MLLLPSLVSADSISVVRLQRTQLIFGSVDRELSPRQLYETGGTLVSYLIAYAQYIDISFSLISTG